MAKAVEINIEQLDQAIQRSMGEHIEVLKAPPNPREQRLGLFSTEGINIGDVIGQADQARATFCSVWPKAKSFIKMAVGFMGMFVPGAAAAGAIVDGIDQQIYPLLCRGDVTSGRQ